ncbi:MAG: S41 family peptidase [Aliidongia sp.]
MRLTTARYYTPSGRSIQGHGIDPDIMVEPAKIEKIALGERPHESDLKGALRTRTTRRRRPTPRRRRRPARKGRTSRSRRRTRSRRIRMPRRPRTAPRTAMRPTRPPAIPLQRITS